MRDDFPENALFDWAYMPILPPELTVAICAWRHLQGGRRFLHYNGFDDDGTEGERPAHIAIKTDLATGLRLAFSPNVRDESKPAMGGEEFVDKLPPDLRKAARPFVFFDKEAFAGEYFRLFDELYETYNNADTRILLAPWWAQGAPKRNSTASLSICTCSSRRCRRPTAYAGTASPRCSGSTISISSTAMSPMDMRFTPPRPKSS